MKTSSLKMLMGLFSIAMLNVACDNSDDNKGTDAPVNFVVNTVTADRSTSYFTPYSNALPSGSVNNISALTRQESHGGGIFTQIGNAYYTVQNNVGDSGIQKYIIENGSIKDSGFIAANTTGKFAYVSSTVGYYLDADKGLLKLQKFNPTTMQRIGELDFTKELSTDEVVAERLGHTILVYRDGKIFVNLHYGKSAAAGGFLDANDDIARIVVIDAATEKIDKITSFDTNNGPQNVGYPATNPMYDFDDNGDFYFISLGGVVTGSGLLRIKKGSTDIDPNFYIKATDLGIGAGSFLGFCTVKGGKIYTRLNTEAIAANFSNLYNEIYDVHQVDPATKKSVKITGVPSHFFGGYANQIFEIDNELYFGARNTAEKINALYKINGTTASKVFDVSQGGDLLGLVKLQ